MHFPPFPPFPPFPLLHFLLVPLLLTAALVFGVLRVAKRRVFALAAGRNDRSVASYCGGRQSRRERHDRPETSGNAAFDDYRRATLAKLETEAAEFRTFLDRLRHAADAADFDAFLKSRRQVGPEIGRGLQTS